MPKKLTIPKSMGACADLLFKLRTERLAAQKVAEEIEEREKALKQHIIDNLAKGDTGASGKTHHVSVYTDPVPRIEDPTKLYAYIKRTGSFDLLQKRLNEAAVKERWEDKKKIPGVATFNVVKVSLTKKKGK